MMKQIWKYQIKTNKLIHEIPKGAKILYVNNQFDQICVWIEVDPEAPKEQRHFEVYGTGHPIMGDPKDRKYLGSVKLSGGALIFHLYEYFGN